MIEVNSPQSVGWTTRLRDANARLRSAPDHRDAWQWRIEVRILSYLISRYGDAANESRRFCVATPVHHRGVTSAHTGYGLRTGRGVREILDRIALANVRSKSI